MSEQGALEGVVEQKQPMKLFMLAMNGEPMLVPAHSAAYYQKKECTTSKLHLTCSFNEGMKRFFDFRLIDGRTGRESRRLIQDTLQALHRKQEEVEWYGINPWFPGCGRTFEAADAFIILKRLLYWAERFPEARWGFCHEQA